MQALQISIVMPCLNEADTLEVCIRKALKSMAEAGIVGEVIVADNGSTDGSIEIAQRCGARVVPVAEKGYGSALAGGIAAAQAPYILMGDADDSYDFLEIPKFYNKIREGFDLVQGCRLPAGGGRVAEGAMPWSHRWIGNPMFSLLVRTWFHAPIHDVYCGMRAFRKDFYESLNQRCTGMEFATEMIIKSSLFRAKIAEVPITLHKDGRVAHPPHLKTVRDGWRTLRFFLMYSPDWLFLVPGLLLAFLGVLCFGVALPRAEIGGLIFDAHTLVYGSVLILCGYQAILFAFLAKTFAIGEGLMPVDSLHRMLVSALTLERSLIAALVLGLLGVGLLTFTVFWWAQTGFGRLDYAQTMRIVIPGATLTALAVQTTFSAFLLSILGMKRK